MQSVPDYIIRRDRIEELMNKLCTWAEQGEKLGAQEFIALLTFTLEYMKERTGITVERVEVLTGPKGSN